MKIVLDTNVLISALLKGRAPDKVIYFILNDPSISWIVNQDIVDEYERVLKRPKFGIERSKIDMWVSIFYNHTHHVTDSEMVDFPRDQKDAKFISCAITSKADYLITGDQDFNDAKDLMATKVVNVKEFIELFDIT
jgi:uncharacterized protein